MVVEQLPQIKVNLGEVGKVLHSTGVLDSMQIDVNQFFNADSFEKMMEENLKELEIIELENGIPDSMMN